MLQPRSLLYDTKHRVLEIAVIPYYLTINSKPIPYVEERKKENRLYGWVLDRKVKLGAINELSILERWITHGYLSENGEPVEVARPRIAPAVFELFYNEVLGEYDFSVSQLKSAIKKNKTIIAYLVQALFLPANQLLGTIFDGGKEVNESASSGLIKAYMTFGTEIRDTIVNNISVHNE